MITKEEAEKAYQQLVVERLKNPPIKIKHGEVEIHHILPTSCGGIDEESNKIALYAKEHFMAHVYLWIIHHDDEFHYQTMCALNQMIKGSVNGLRKKLREFILQSEEYLKAREEYAQYCSETIGLKVAGEKNGNFGNVWINDPILEESFSWPHELELPPFCEYGRIIDFSARRCYEADKQMKAIAKQEHRIKLKELLQTFFTAFYIVYLTKGFDAMRRLFSLIGLSQSSFCHLCKSRVPEYETYKRWHI